MSIFEVNKIFRTTLMPAYLNETLVTLIPKGPGVDCLASFRPISLYNTTYKVVTKIIVKRLRSMLPSLISPFQTAFVPSRLWLDNMIIAQESNMIIAQELIHTMSLKKCKEGFMAIKIDLKKAYDKLK